LHCAAYYGHKHLIPLLLSYGAPIGKKNFTENTPYDEAATDEIKQLLK
jgi:ankyrin repeat protein